MKLFTVYEILLWLKNCLWFMCTRAKFKILLRWTLTHSLPSCVLCRTCIICSRQNPAESFTKRRNLDFYSRQVSLYYVSGNNCKRCNRHKSIDCRLPDCWNRNGSFVVRRNKCRVLIWKINARARSKMMSYWMASPQLKHKYELKSKVIKSSSFWNSHSSPTRSFPRGQTRYCVT